MSKRNLDQILQKRVRNYYEYLHDKRNIFDEEAEQLIQDLPHSIKQEVIYDINMKLLSSHKIFSLQFSKQFQQDLSLCMKILKYGPEINVISQNDQVISQLYFVLEGNLDVNMKLDSKSISVSVLKKGDMFGLIEFFSQKSSEFSVKTLNVVTIAYIDYQDFINALKNNPQDQVNKLREKYYLIKDKISQYNDLSALDFQCYGCKRYGHGFFQCKSINFDYKKNRIIQDFMNVNSNFTMERNQQFQRSKQKKSNKQNFTQQIIANQQQEFCSNNENFIQNYYHTYKFIQSDHNTAIQDQTFEIYGDQENMQFIHSFLIQKLFTKNIIFRNQLGVTHLANDYFTGTLQVIEEESKDIQTKKVKLSPPRTAMKKNFTFLADPKKISILQQERLESNTHNDDVDTSVVCPLLEFKIDLRFLIRNQIQQIFEQLFQIK